MLTILLFIIVLSLLVFVHEFGHFLMARKMGMKVEEFGFGFPPRAFGVKRGNTIYSINWIPLGGFVRIKGESGEHKEDHDSFASKKAWQRFVVLVAGVGMNLVLAAVLFSIGFMVGLPAVVDESLPASARVADRALTVMAVVDKSPAALSGIEQGDRLLSIDGEEFESSDVARTQITKSAQDGVLLNIKKQNGDVRSYTLISALLPEQDLNGIGIGLVETGLISYPFFHAVIQGVAATATFTVEVVRAFVGIIVNLVSGQGVGVELSGPVGIAVITGQVAALGFVYLLQFTALLSINLAVINVLPFPALDGGRILFLMIEKLRGRAVNGKLETVTHNLGFFLLMVLVVLVTYRDIVGIITK